jgi:RNA polymerase sigma-70 factor, ECF subfamily
MSDDPNVLIEAVALRQDTDAFTRLFAVFSPRIKGFLMRSAGDAMVAEELTQEVMLRVWKRAPSFNPERGSASSWIFTIARNARIDHHRRKRPMIDESDPALVVDTSPAADHHVHRVETAVRVRKAMSALPEEQAQVVQWSYLEGRTLRETAIELGIPLGTAKSRSRMAMAKLRLALGGET